MLGPGVIEDMLAGVPLRMGVHEFYQVNTPAAEVLYAKAREYARLRPDDFLLDLYCGMGTIGLSMLADCKRLVGVEVVPQAVEGAKGDRRAAGTGRGQSGLPLSGCRCSRRPARCRGCASRRDRRRPAPQGLRRGDPDCHCRDGPADRGHGQLQRRNSGKGMPSG